MPQKRRIIAVLLLTVSITIFCSNIPLAPPLFGDTIKGPKIHLLFVWGTKAGDTRTATLISKAKIEAAFKDFKSIGLREGSKHVGTYQALEGEDAHPKKILDACKAIAVKAGPNDAVLVYILCHGGATYETNDKEEKTKVHALSPICSGADNLQLPKIGIRRLSIMKALQSQKHRLDILITDACAVNVSPNEPVKPVIKPAPVTEHVSLLERFLLTAKGEININSANPYGGSMKQGELALAWIPAAPKGVQGEQFIKYAATESQYSGTVFTNAFITYSQQEVEKNSSFSTGNFFTGLKEQLQETSKAVKKMAVQKMQEDGADATIFMRQPPQTLTKFDGGVVIPDGAVSY